MKKSSIMTLLALLLVTLLSLFDLETLRMKIVQWPAAIPCLVVLWMFAVSRSRWANIAIFMTVAIWIWAHMFPEVPAEKDRTYGIVVKASGCQTSEETLLIALSDSLFKAKGRAVAGDVVQVVVSRGFRASARSSFVVEGDGLVCAFIDRVNERIHQRLLRMDDYSQRWLRSLLLGEERQLDSLTMSQMRDYGMMHMLVLSGGHLWTVTAVMFGLLALPLRVVYGLRWLLPRNLAPLFFAMQLSVLLSVIVFCFLSGLQPSLQRAMVMSVFLTVSAAFFPGVALWQKLLLVFIFQGLLFPMDALSFSSVLSWCGALILAVAQRVEEKLWPAHDERCWLRELTRSVSKLVVMQSCFAVLGCVVFGNYSVIQILSNLVFGPLFALGISVGFVLLLPIFPVSLASDLAGFTREGLFHLLRIWSDYVGQSRLTGMRLDEMAPVRALVALAVIIVCLVVLSQKESASLQEQ